MKIIVIGINHAGTSAIRTLLELNPKLEVLAFDRNSNISFLGCGIALSISGVVKNVNDLFYSNPNQLISMGAKVFMNHDVIEIDEENKKIKVQNLDDKKINIYEYDKLIYSGGSWPIDLKIKNNTLNNIKMCKTYQDAQKLINYANNDNFKNICIIGAGYIGIELVESFIKKGKKVSLIDCKNRVLFNNVDYEISSVIEKKLTDNKVDLFLDQFVTEYIGDKNVEKIKTSKNEIIKADLVIECAGICPNTKLLKNVNKIRNGAVIVNKKCLSSNKDIYVIGDACAIYDNAIKDYQNIALATNAVKTGIVAACDICKVEKMNIDGIVGTNALCVFNTNIATTGISEETAKRFKINFKSFYFEDNDRPEWMNEYDKVGIKIIYDPINYTLLGSQIISHNTNHSEWIFALAIAIQNNMNLFQIATSDVYFLPHFNKPFNFVLSAILSILGFKYFDKKPK